MAREREDADRSGRSEPGTNARTTVGEENARREERERFQREHPDELAARGRDPQRDEPPVDADDDSERFRARENEDVSEG
jgi:hypothetical protein